MASDTVTPSGTASLWTPPGRGAVATIRIQVPLEFWDEHALFTPHTLPTGERWPLNRIVYGRWGRGSEHVATEDVVCARIAAEQWELHCHGGIAAVARILGDLAAVGIVTRSWSEQLAETAGEVVAQWHAALSQTTTQRTAEWVLRQSPAHWRATLLRWQSLWTAGEHALVEQQLTASLAAAEFGVHLTQPWRVVLTGRPNVGKSALLNALVGYSRAVVYDQPGTTRDVVTALWICDGWPVELRDTAGLRVATSELEAAGIELAESELAVADVSLFVVDGSAPLTTEDATTLARYPASLVLINKCDLPAAWDWAAHPEWVPVSALTGVGLDTLSQTVAQRLVQKIPGNEVLCPYTTTLANCLRDLHIQRTDPAAWERVLEMTN